MTPKELEYEPQAGDVGFVGHPKGAGFITDAISYFTRDKGEAPTLAQHQFQVLAGCTILEAGSNRKKGAVIRNIYDRFADCDKDGSHWCIFRPVTTLYQKGIIQAKSRELEGARYGYTEILLQLGDAFLRRRGLLSRGKPLLARLGALVPGTVICSGVSNQCLAAAGLVPPEYVYLAPDDTFDFVCTRWAMVAHDDRGRHYWKAGLDAQPQPQQGDHAP